MGEVTNCGRHTNMCKEVLNNLSEVHYFRLVAYDARVLERLSFLSAVAAPHYTPHYR